MEAAGCPANHKGTRVRYRPDSLAGFPGMRVPELLGPTGIMSSKYRKPEVDVVEGRQTSRYKLG